jgi:hypothetical protein
MVDWEEIRQGGARSHCLCHIGHHLDPLAVGRAVDGEVSTTDLASHAPSPPAPPPHFPPPSLSPSTSLSSIPLDRFTSSHEGR